MAKYRLLKHDQAVAVGEATQAELDPSLPR